MISMTKNLIPNLTNISPHITDDSNFGTSDARLATSSWNANVSVFFAPSFGLGIPWPQTSIERSGQKVLRM